jgi:signal transduction histidine kinase
MENTPSQLLKRYQRLVEVTHYLASKLELNPLLDNIMKIAVELVGAAQASVLLYDQNTRQLYFHATTNTAELPALQNMRIPEESIAGWVALNRMPQIVNHVEQDARHFDKIDADLNFQTTSLIAVPLVVQDKLIGVLEALNKVEGQFNLEDQEILLALGAQAAVAIENARLFQQSDLVAEFVHELRTPLASVFTASYLLQRPEIATDQRIRLAQTIHQETQRLNDLVTVFLDLSSLESGRSAVRLTSFDPRLVFDECLQVAQIKADEKSIEMILVVPEPLANLSADRDMIKQALLNLLSNAVKYNRAQGKVWLHALQKPDGLQIRIADTGVGIPSDQISRLFTKFFRARNVEDDVPGTGLGLSITRRIIEMHNGQIQVESKIDTGTTFVIWLPNAPLAA